jgi:hypothetical protein
MMMLRSAREIRATNPRANHFEELPTRMRHPVVPRSTPLSNGSMKRKASVSLSWVMAQAMRSFTLASCKILDSML